MRKPLLLALAIFGALLFSNAASAQNITSVSGTVVDPNGLPYANGTIQAQLIPAGITPTIPPPCNGQSQTPCSVNPFTSASLDINGHFSMNLASNVVLTPSGTKWQFTVSGTSGLPPPVGTGTQTFASSITISGASQNISSTLNALAPALTNIASSSGSVTPGAQYRIPLYPNSGTANVLGPSNIFTDATKNNLTVPGSLESVGDALFASGLPWWDVTANGVICDGVDDQTAEMAALIAKVIAANTSTGSSGIIYSPRTPQPCVFNGNVFAASHAGGWLYIVQDGAWILTGPVTPAPFTHFVGRGSTFLGSALTSFMLATAATWQPVNGNTEAVLLTGNQEDIYFEGIRLNGGGAGGATTVPLFDIECDGSNNMPSYITMHNMAIYTNSAIAPIKAFCANNPVNGGYWIHSDNFVLGVGAGATTAAQITNFGEVMFQYGTVTGGGFNFLGNTGGNAGGGIFEDMIFEDTNNNDFLTMQATSGTGVEQNFQLRHVLLADATAPAYLLKAIGNNVRDVRIEGEDEGGIGSGILDPASSVVNGLLCMDNGCQTINPALALNLRSFPSGKGDFPSQISGGDATGNSGLDGAGLQMLGGMDYQGVTDAFLTGSGGPTAGFGRTGIDSSTGGFKCFLHSGICPLGTPTAPWANLNLGAGILVGSLPSAAANKGQMQVVSDSTTVSAEGQTCAGSSTNTALAFSNGSVWKCF